MSNEEREANNRRQCAVGTVYTRMLEMLIENPGMQKVAIGELRFIADHARDLAYDAIREAEGISA